jgi:hypothetical protein
MRIEIMNTLRRPILSPSHPKKYPAGTEATPEGQPVQHRLALGQVPIANDKGQDGTDQKDIDEIERKRKEVREENFPLACRQRSLLFEKLQHGFLPFVRAGALAGPLSLVFD